MPRWLWLWFKSSSKYSKYSNISNIPLWPNLLWHDAEMVMVFVEKLFQIFQVFKIFFLDWLNVPQHDSEMVMVLLTSSSLLQKTFQAPERRLATLSSRDLDHFSCYSTSYKASRGSSPKTTEEYSTPVHTKCLNWQRANCLKSHLILTKGCGVWKTGLLAGSTKGRWLWRPLFLWLYHPFRLPPGCSTRGVPSCGVAPSFDYHI